MYSRLIYSYNSYRSKITQLDASMLAMLYSGLDSVISNKIAIKLALLTLKIPQDIDRQNKVLEQNLGL